MLWLLFSWERDTVSIILETGWASGPVWICTENLILTGKTKENDNFCLGIECKCFKSEFLEMNG